MSSALIISAVSLGLLLLSAVLWALLLRRGLRWAEVPNVTMRGIVVTTAVVITIQFAFSLLFHMAPPSTNSEFSLGGLGQVLLAIILQLAIVRLVFTLRLGKLFQAWLPTLAASAATAAIAAGVVRPWLYEAFVVPTNAMAPTLVASHSKNVCPECKQPNYGSPMADRYGSREPCKMICDNFHVSQIANVGTRTFAGDRFIVGKFLTPRRWDMIVFRYPAKPDILYVKRLVGLPGETIQIKDDSVWANGQKLEPPKQIANIKYLAEIPEMPQNSLWGSANRLAILGEDEYFVLGDFSAQSTDSRNWENGAANHSPFAVPESHFIGVVTHTFWPPSRFRIHRQ
jgi:signal peptidase I